MPADTDSAALEQRIVEAVLGCAGPALATGWAGLAWLGGRWFGGLAPDGRTPRAVPVALGDRRVVRPRPGVQVTEDWLFVDDRIEVDGLPLTTPERSVTWEARRARTLVAAVQVIDMAAYDDLVDVETLGDYVARLPCRPGVVRLREALRWSDENAWSPQEVAMRLCWRRERPWSNPRSNLPLFDSDGHHLLTPDLLDVDRGVAGEYDGAVHLGDGVRRRDLDREALCRDLGIEVVTMMSSDRTDVAHFLSRLDRAYRRAARIPAGARPWTTDRPSWWVDTSTVAARRRLDSAERMIWLRRRT